MKFFVLSFGISVWGFDPDIIYMNDISTDTLSMQDETQWFFEKSQLLERKDGEIVKFRDLNMSNGYLFGRVMQDMELLRRFLCNVLEKEITEIVFEGDEYAISPKFGKHGIRIDVLAKDADKNKYFVEIQNAKEYNIGKRTRYYHSVSDVESLYSGDGYEKLPDTYIVFISMTDPHSDFASERVIKEKYHHQKYVFNQYSGYGTDYKLPSDNVTVVLANVKENRIDPENEDVFITELFKYLENSTDEVAEDLTDGLVLDIHNRVCKLRESKAETEGYEMFGLAIQDELNEVKRLGREEGRSLGREEGRKTGKFEVAKKLLARGDFSGEEIASLTDLTVEEVQSMK